MIEKRSFKVKDWWLAVMVGCSEYEVKKSDFDESSVALPLDGGYIGNLEWKSLIEERIMGDLK